MLKKLVVFLFLISAFNLLEAHNISTPLFSQPLQINPKAAYQNQQLVLTGLSGSGKLEVYSIIGNKIKEINIQELYNLKLYLELDAKKMFVLRITSSTDIHTFKIITP
ncbi:MAG: hypothetical protein ACPGCO_07270 [Flavobacteriaceae bacterium]